VDPLTCLKCSAKMEVISVIEDKDVILEILRHLRFLWVSQILSPLRGHADPLS